MAELRGCQQHVVCSVEGCKQPVRYQCKNCDDALCITCEEKHRKRKTDHRVVLYAERKNTLCTEHTENKCMYWCKKCKEAVCEICANSTHRKHKLKTIDDAIRAKREKITKQLEGPIPIYMTEWKSLLQKAKEQAIKYRDNIEEIDHALISHVSRIHQAVETGLEKVRKDLREIRENTLTALKAQEKAINDRYDEFQSNIERLEELRDSTAVNLLHYRFDISDMKCLPVLTTQLPPDYIFGQINEQTLLKMIGDLNTTIRNVTHENATSTIEIPRPLPTILPTPKIVSSFSHSNYFPFITCTPSAGLAWVDTSEDCIQMMDRNGEILETINTEFEFEDIVVTPRGAVLFTDIENWCIVSVSMTPTSWEMKNLFPTPQEPCGICLLRNGNVVVTFRNVGHRVIQYSKKGAIRYEFDPDLFSDPYRVTVNKVNEDLYVSDNNKLLAFKKDHTLRYKYTGSATSSFDICTDTNGLLLITDSNKNRIHVVDKDGKFLQYIQIPGLNAPQYIDVDSDGHTWIGELTGEIKILKY